MPWRPLASMNIRHCQGHALYSRLQFVPQVFVLALSKSSPATRLAIGTTDLLGWFSRALMALPCVSTAITWLVEYDQDLSRCVFRPPHSHPLGTWCETRDHGEEQIKGQSPLACKAAWLGMGSFCASTRLHKYFLQHCVEYLLCSRCANVAIFLNSP